MGHTNACAGNAEAHAGRSGDKDAACSHWRKEMYGIDQDVLAEAGREWREIANGTCS